MCLLKTLVLSVPDRHYKRIRIKPIGKWYFCTNLHKNNINH